MSIGWVTDLAAAETYFLTNRLDSTAWAALIVVSGGLDQKTAVLNMAYVRIRFSSKWTIPTTPTAAQLEKLQLAQYETAYYLAMHGADEDRRKGLHAQGVVGSNIVGETYVRFESDSMKLQDLPFPPIVHELMAAFEVDADAKPFYAVEIGRDENKDIDEDVTDDY